MNNTPGLMRLMQKCSAAPEPARNSCSPRTRYSVLTRLPPPRRMRGADAPTLIEGNWSNAPAVHLTARETWEAVRIAERVHVTGGQTYDALIARSVLTAGASTILTWNVRHFARFAGQIAVECPP